MKKFFALVLLGAAFAAGYYVGQQPPEEVKRQLHELSQDVVEQTIGLGEGEKLLARQKIVQAMSEFVDGKAKILDGKSDEAIDELEDTLDYLKEALKMKGTHSPDALIETMSSIDSLRQSLAGGQAVSQEALADVEAKLKALSL